MTARWLTLIAAAREVGCARMTLWAAIHQGDLRSYCDRCHRPFSQRALAAGHRCPRAPAAVYRKLVVRQRDLPRLSVNPGHQAAGRASATKRRHVAALTMQWLQRSRA